MENPNIENLYLLNLKGLVGGHSGVNIHCNRANAAIALSSLINEFIVPENDFFLQTFSSGIAHNAIPTSAKCSFYSKKKITEEDIQNFQNYLKTKYSDTDPNITIELISLKNNNLNAMTTKDSISFLKMMNNSPNGVNTISAEMRGLTESSSNIAFVEADETGVKVVISMRSSLDSALESLIEKIEQIAQNNDFEISFSGAYPSWQPQFGSSLNQKCEAVFEKIFGKKPIFEIIHAGLECGIIKSKYPKLESISLGPIIENPHSFLERVNIKSVEKIYDFIKELIISF